MILSNMANDGLNEGAINLAINPLTVLCIYLSSATVRIFLSEAGVLITLRNCHRRQRHPVPCGDGRNSKAASAILAVSRLLSLTFLVCFVHKHCLVDNPGVWRFILDEKATPWPLLPCGDLCRKGSHLVFVVRETATRTIATLA